MKKYITIILIFTTCQLAFGQEKSNFSKRQLSVDFGSFRNRYLFPITDIKYSSPVLKKMRLRYSARLRSYGTLYFFSKSSYDFTPCAEYYFTYITKSVYFSAGLGLDTRIRLVNDARSNAATSAEPLMSFTLYSNYKKLSFNAPFWTRFYTNGISFSLLPEAQYKIGKRISIFIRYELSRLSIYKVSSTELRHDSFIGTQILF